MGILSSIFTVSLSLLISLIVILGIRVATAYYSMGYYRKQGIRSYFGPLLGLFGVAIKKQRPGVRRFDEYLEEEFKDDYKRGAIVNSGIGSGSPEVALLTAEYFREYIAQEDKFIRRPFLPIVKKFGRFSGQAWTSRFERKTPLPGDLPLRQDQGPSAKDFR